MQFFFKFDLFPSKNIFIPVATYKGLDKVTAPTEQMKKLFFSKIVKLKKFNIKFHLRYDTELKSAAEKLDDSEDGFPAYAISAIIAGFKYWEIFYKKNIKFI